MVAAHMTAGRLPDVAGARAGRCAPLIYFSYAHDLSHDGDLEYCEAAFVHRKYEKYY